MLSVVIQESALSNWLFEYLTHEGPPPPEVLAEFRRHQEELAANVAAALGGMAVPDRVAVKWLHFTTGSRRATPAEVQRARGALEAFLHIILPQMLADPRGLHEVEETGGGAGGG